MVLSPGVFKSLEDSLCSILCASARSSQFCVGMSNRCSPISLKNSHKVDGVVEDAFELGVSPN